MSPISELTRNVLIAEDDDDDFEIFSEAMQQLSITIIVSRAENGDILIKLLSEKHPDMLFLDLNMPRMNGKQCLREIRNLQYLNGIPVVIYSTSSERRDMEETKALGAAAFITKPPGISELIRRLQDILIELQ